MAIANSDPLFTSVSYYVAGGKKFRVETASNWPKCEESKRARKIFLDQPNELREVAVWKKDGKLDEAGKSNKPELHREVEAIFARSLVSGNPCVKALPSSDAAKATAQ